MSWCHKIQGSSLRGVAGEHHSENSGRLQAMTTRGTRLAQSAPRPGHMHAPNADVPKVRTSGTADAGEIEANVRVGCVAGLALEVTLAADVLAADRCSTAKTVGGELATEFGLERVPREVVGRRRSG